MNYLVLDEESFDPLLLADWTAVAETAPGTQFCTYENGLLKLAVGKPAVVSLLDKVCLMILSFLTAARSLTLYLVESELTKSSTLFSLILIFIDLRMSNTPPFESSG